MSDNMFYADPGESVYRFFERAVRYAVKTGFYVCAEHNDIRVFVHPESHHLDLLKIYDLEAELRRYRG